MESVETAVIPRPGEVPPSSWVEIRVDCLLDTQEAVTAFLWELGAEGLTEEATARGGKSAVRLRAYLQARRPEAVLARTQEFLSSLVQYFPGAASGRVSLRPVQQKDWNAAWKERFEPFRVSPRLIIRPSWRDYLPAPGEVIIELDPGMASGTGTHETTRACLRAIDALMGGGGIPVTPLEGGVNVADVGTGTGILLIAALKLGGIEGCGIDLDPLAIDAARDNCRRNGLEDRAQILEGSFERFEETFSLVLANILATPLIEMSPALSATVAPRGALVLSGMLDYQAPSVQAAYEKQGLKVETRLREGEWTSLVLRRA